MSYPPFQHEVASEMHTLSEIDPLFSTFAELHSSQSAIDCSSAWTIIDKIIAFTDCILYLSKVLLFLSLDDTCWRNVVAIYRTHPQNFQAMLLLWPDLYHGLPAELMHLLQQLRDDAHWDLVKEGALSALEAQKTSSESQRSGVVSANPAYSRTSTSSVASSWNVAPPSTSNPTTPQPEWWYWCLASGCKRKVGFKTLAGLESHTNSCHLGYDIGTPARCATKSAARAALKKKVGPKKDGRALAFTPLAGTVGAKSSPFAPQDVEEDIQAGQPFLSKQSNLKRGSQSSWSDDARVGIPPLQPFERFSPGPAAPSSVDLSSCMGLPPPPRGHTAILDQYRTRNPVFGDDAMVPLARQVSEHGTFNLKAGDIGGPMSMYDINSAGQSRQMDLGGMDKQGFQDDGNEMDQYWPVRDHAS